MAPLSLLPPLSFPVTGSPEKSTTRTQPFYLVRGACAQLSGVGERTANLPLIPRASDKEKDGLAVTLVTLREKAKALTVACVVLLTWPLHL